MRGGRRINSGPPPDPNAVRRDRKSDEATWTMLDAKPAMKRAPNWPLARRETFVVQTYGLSESDDYFEEQLSYYEVLARKLDKRESELWTLVWRTPQSAMWKQLGWSHEVALYIRLLVNAEHGDSKSASEARQWSDRLGLSSAAMLRLRWKVRDDNGTSTPVALASVSAPDFRERRTRAITGAPAAL